jgi:hypothetical protein
MSVFSPLEFAAKLMAMGAVLDVAEEVAIAESCAMLTETAKDLIGVPKAEWPPLAPSTLARKDNVNTPLLETGEMRDSIHWNSDAHEGYVGSDNMKLVWQEFGTSRIPPRPVLGLAFTRKEDEVHKIAEKAVGEAVAGLGEIFGALREIGHLARKAGEDVREMVQPEDDNNDR